MVSAGETHNQRLTIGVVVTLLLLSTISFVLRIYARTKSAAKLWYDDYWMVVVMVLCCGMSACDFAGLTYGSGKHQSELDVETVMSFMKNLYAYMIIWTFGVLGVKVGILFFYWRVFATQRVRFFILLVAALSTSTFVVNIFTFIFQCLPISRFWDDNVSGTCINQSQFYFASAIINVVGDVAVLALPMPVVWQLHTSRNKKWSLSFLFLLGAFVCIASIFRIVALKQVNPRDFTFSNLAGGLWSTVEVEIGFICANLPAIRPLINSWFKLGSGSTDASNSGYGAYGGRSGTGGGYGTHSKTGATSRGRMHLSSHNADRDIELMSHGNSSDENYLTKGVRPASVHSDNNMGTRITAGQVHSNTVSGGIRVDTQVELTVDEWRGDSDTKPGEPYGIPL